METRKYTAVTALHNLLLTSSEVELMETPTRYITVWVKARASDFLGSWINGNPYRYNNAIVKFDASDFLGSWINGNNSMITLGLITETNTSDFLGSWINGNKKDWKVRQKNAISSDFLGSWINGNHPYLATGRDKIPNFWLPRKLN